MVYKNMQPHETIVGSTKETSSTQKRVSFAFVIRVCGKPNWITQGSEDRDQDYERGGSQLALVWIAVMVVTEVWLLRAEEIYS
jgi:hypothetical protein